MSGKPGNFSRRDFFKTAGATGLGSALVTLKLFGAGTRQLFNEGA